MGPSRAYLYTLWYIIQYLLCTGLSQESIVVGWRLLPELGLADMTSQHLLSQSLLPICRECKKKTHWSKRFTMGHVRFEPIN
jgi:hypothetical protein